jgi:hypothetical protein
MMSDPSETVLAEHGAGQNGTEEAPAAVDHSPGYIDTTTIAAEVAGLAGRNSSAVLDFDAVFDLYMAQNTKAWGHDRASTVGASEVWQCLRKVWFDKRGQEFGFEKDPDHEENYGAMERGNLIENYYVVPGLRLALPKLPTLPEGVELLLGGSNQQTIVLGKNSATPDGIIKGLTPGPLTIRGGKQEIFIPDIKADCIVLEIKSIDPRATLLEEKEKHHGQTQVQLGLIREMTEFKPFFSIVLYIDASFLTVTPFVVEFDEKYYATSKVRALDVYRINDPMMIMPEGRFRGECDTCPWRKPCGTMTTNNIPARKVSDPVAVAEADPLVVDYFRIKKEYEDMEVRLKVAQEAVKETMMDHNTRSLKGATWSATWYPVKGRITIDTKRLAEDFDLTPYEKEGAPHDQIRITEHLPDTAQKKTRKTKLKKESNANE